MDGGLNTPRYMEEARFVDVRRREYRITLWRGAEKEQPQTEQITDLWIGDKMGIWWHLLPKLLDGMAYNKMDIERLRMSMRNDTGKEEEEEEEGKFHVFCVNIGRKPAVKSLE